MPGHAGIFVSWVDRGSAHFYFPASGRALHLRCRAPPALQPPFADISARCWYVARCVFHCLSSSTPALCHQSRPPCSSLRSNRSRREYATRALAVSASLLVFGDDSSFGTHDERSRFRRLRSFSTRYQKGLPQVRFRRGFIVLTVRCFPREIDASLLGSSGAHDLIVRARVRTRCLSTLG